MKRPVAHEHIRELIAAHIDGPLTRAQQRLLAGHLRSCAQCRQVEQDYRAQRAQLRSMPIPLPPRDLWPRTSAALDREIARHPARFMRRGDRRHEPLRLEAGRQRRHPSAALVGVLAAIGAVTAFASIELAPDLGRGSLGGASQPTPFSIAEQQLAFIGSNQQDLAVYRTQVDRACPTTTPECVGGEDITGTPIELPNGIKPQNVALSPSGRQLALVGQDVGRDVFAVVMLPATATGTTDGGGNATGGDGTAGDTLPAGDGGQLQSPGAGGQGAGGDGGNSSAAPQTPDTVSGSSGEAPRPGESSLPTTPPASAVAGLTVLAILENVESAGAPPAWSQDGSTLAFSAMPADGSHGPDVYIWQPSDTRARAITNDHASFFASWSGSHIVISRVENTAVAGAPSVATVVIDPQTLVERVVDGPQMWLPTVNADRDEAVVWYGRLDWNGPLPTPGDGSLYLADWSKLDPFANDTGDQSGDTSSPAPDATPAVAPPTAPTSPQPGASASPAASPAVSPTPSASPSASSSASASGAPPATPKASTSPGTSATPAAATTKPSASPSASPQSSAGSASSAPSAEPSETAQPPLPSVLTPIAPASSAGAVIDWQVRWSSDGQVLGVWIADVSGSTWGRLMVMSLDPQTAALSLDAPLVAPTLARRGFTLGMDRVAFVAPADSTPEGELRIRTWGPDGTGDLHVRAPDLEGLVPAF